MTFEDLLAQIITLLQREKRMSYRALKRRFGLDDDYLEDLKEEIIYAKNLAADEDGSVLVWIGEPETGPSGYQGRDSLSYTPAHLAERILASRSAFEGERKQVTVLFADIKDSSNLIENLDPEVAQQLLDPAIHCMIDAVHRYEGTVNQVLGDGIMALFGAPLAHEDHAIRACYAALAMQASIRDYAEKVRQVHDVGIRIRVGLNSGEVVVRAIGNDLHMDYTAVGSTTHLTARMEQLATPGSTWMTTATYRLVEGLVQVNGLGSVPVKGISEPVGVYELVGVNVFRKRLQVKAERGLTPFVGRQSELEVLQKAQDQALTGHGQIVAVVGEAGIGKSRLVYEFVHSRQTEGWLVLESASASYGRVAPYYQILDLLRRYFHIEDDDSPGIISDKVTNRLMALDDTLQGSIPALLALLDVLPEDSPFQQLHPEQQRQFICDALKRILLFESRIQPLLLVFEDLHWLDSETRLLLDGLIESVPMAQLLLVVSYRPEYRHDWGGRTYYEQLRLDPLPPVSAEELLHALLGGDSSLERLKHLLIERTEGNPFFLEESVRDLVENEALIGERGAYRLVKALQTIEIPAQVQAILAARIDRLPPEEKRLLQYAAVIGKDVPFVLLQALAEMPEEALRRGLAHLQATEFLYETQLFPELEYTFRHSLTHEVAYNGMLERHRRAYHAAAGDSLEKLFEGRIEEVMELLAYHFGQSYEKEKAVDYAILAAEKAQRRWANTEALNHFEAALRHLETMPENVPNQLRRIDAVLKQGEVKFALGLHKDHIEALEGVRDIATRVADPRRLATWYYWMGFLQSFTGSQPQVTISYCREASSIAEENGFEDIRAFAESCLAQVYVFTGDFRGAATAGERALATFEERGDIWWACRTLWHLITAANALGDWERSLEWCRRALGHGQSVDDFRLKVVGLWRMGATYNQLGDPKTGLHWCNEARDLNPAPYDAAMVRAARGHSLVNLGEIEAGTAELEEAVTWFEQANLLMTRSIFALYLGEAYLMQGQRQRAQRIFKEVLTTMRESGNRYREGVALRLLGESLSTKDPTAASYNLELARPILEEVGARNEVAKTLVALADLRKKEGNYDEAQKLLERALAIFEALGTIDGPVHVRAALAELQKCVPN